MIFKKISTLGTGMSYDEYKERTLSPCFNGRKSSYLKKEDLTDCQYDFEKKLPEDKSQIKFRFSKVKLSDDEEKVKKLSKRM